jgi:hypothetical protein
VRRDRPAGPLEAGTRAVLVGSLVAFVLVGGVAVVAGADPGGESGPGVDGDPANDSDSSIEVQWNRSYEHETTIETGSDPIDTRYPVVVEDVTLTTDGDLAVAGTVSTWSNSVVDAQRDAVVLGVDSDGNRIRMGMYGGAYPDGWNRRVDCRKGITPIGEQDPPYYQAGESCGVGDPNREKPYGNMEVDEEGHAVAATEDGGVVVAGITNTYGSGHRMDYSPKNPWLLKVDAQGEEVWNRTYQSSPDKSVNSATFTSVIQTDDGGYLVVGKSQEFDGGRHDVWILKVDSGGDVTWSRGYGGKYNDRANDVVQTSNGNYAVAGTTFSYTTGDVPAGNQDVWLLVVDDEGDVLVNRTYTGAREGGARTFESGYAIIEPSEGGFLLAGTTTAFTESPGDNDAWLIRTDRSGDVRWNRTYGGPAGSSQNTDTPVDLVETPDGGYIFAGGTETLTDEQRSPWLVKTADDGTKQWHETFTVGRFSSATGLAKTSSGDYVLTLEATGHDDVERGRVIKFSDTTELPDDSSDDADETTTTGDATTSATTVDGTTAGTDDGTTGNTDDSTSRDLPGFGTGVALLAILVGLLGLRYARS